AMHRSMAATLDTVLDRIRSIQEQARAPGWHGQRPKWPMIVLRSPKGWTGPKEVDGEKVEGFWRSHQVPVSNARGNEEHRKILENWMRSYEPGELFDESGHLLPELAALAPTGTRRMGASPYANGGLLKRDLMLP
ncbi:phosphoketolase, partial [Mesorhizobium sp. M7A.F.Ca.US.002.01.1.1]